MILKKREEKFSFSRLEKLKLLRVADVLWPVKGWYLVTVSKNWKLVVKTHVGTRNETSSCHKAGFRVKFTFLKGHLVSKVGTRKP